MPQLKEHRGTVTVKVEEVLLPIFAGGLLTKRQMQIAWTVISDSWRWRNQRKTQHEMTLGRLKEITGIDRAHLSRDLKDMLNRNILIRHRSRTGKIQLEFNEHFGTWGVAEKATPKTPRGVAKRATPKAVQVLPKKQHPKPGGCCQKSNRVLPKKQQGVAKRANPTPLNPLKENKIHNPKINSKINIKINKDQRAEKRARKFIFDLITKMLKLKNGKEPERSFVGKLIKSCKPDKLDMNPVDLIEKQQTPIEYPFSWLGNIMEHPDRYRDGVRPWYTFEETIPVEADPEVAERFDQLINHALKRF